MDNKFWKSAVWAGVIAAVVMLMLELIMNPLFLGSPIWGPPRMMAAILLGKGVLPPPASFSVEMLLGAMAVHGALSIIFAIILSFIIKKLSLTVAVLIGAIFGLALYFINFYGFTSIFPWFANARNWVQIVIHILFGIVSAWAFKSIIIKLMSPNNAAPEA